MKQTFVPLYSVDERIFVGLLITPTDSGADACVACVSCLEDGYKLRPFPGRSFHDAFLRAVGESYWFLGAGREVGEYSYGPDDIVIADLIL